MARGPFNNIWASSPVDFDEPTTLRIISGWEGGLDKDPPPAGEENWWHNRVDSALQDLERYGALSYHPLAIYAMGAPTRATDGNYYESLANNNQGNDPLNSTGFWRLIGPRLYAYSQPGDYKDVAHNGIPDAGWLKCNGAVPIRSSSQRLFDKIGTAYNRGGETSLQFRLPDWRGEFPRGFDDGRGVDSGRGLGSLQAGQIEAHNHLAKSAIGGNAGGTPTGDSRYVLQYVQNGARDVNGFGDSTGLLTNETGGSETRPRNLTFVRWIKY